MSPVMADSIETDARINRQRVVSFEETILDITRQLTSRDFESLKFLCADFISLGTLENVKYAIRLITELRKLCLIESPDNVSFLAELLWHIGRNDLLKKLNYSSADVELKLIPDPQHVHVSPYRLLLHGLCQELTREECNTLKFTCEHDIPRARLESIQGLQDFFRVLESQHKISADNLDFLLHRLKLLNRQDLVRKVVAYRNTLQRPCSVGHGSSENIAVSFTPAAIQYHCPGTVRHSVSERDKLGDRNSFGQYDAFVQQQQQPVRPTDCRRGADTMTADDRTVYMSRQTPQNSSDEMLCYSMTRKPRGICIIISNEKFYKQRDDPTSTEMPERPGTKVDQANLEKCFKNLDFIVECFENLTDEEMMASLMRMTRIDHSSYDCFVCCILSHGALGSVYGVNGRTISLRDLMFCVKAVNCPTLLGKPKMFFIQACQGVAKQPGFDIETDSADAGFVETIPNEADFLLGLATVPGFVSYRSRSQGSWYITTLARLLVRYADSQDMLSILTQVNYDVSRAYTQEGNYKQVPQPVYTLRKRVLFQ